MTKLAVQAVLEILGRPKEHILIALSQLIEKISQEKGIAVREKIIHEPVPVENTKDLFTTFAELTLDLESFEQYFTLIFRYLPSHIEIIEPESLPLSNREFNEMGNRIIQRLHEYDAVTKRALYERDEALNKSNSKPVSKVEKQEKPRKISKKKSKH